MARVAGAFGIKGWLKLHIFTQSPDSLDAYASWLLKGDKGWEEFELEDFAPSAAIERFREMNIGVKN